MLPKAVYPLL